MLNDYKPTHDPSIDTFKVQYLLGGAAVLAILFPYKYQPTEVSALSAHPSCSKYPCSYNLGIDPMGLLYMARIRSHTPPTLHAPAHW